MSANTEHYYGDVVRVMFMGAALLMIIGLPYFTQQGLLPVPLSVSIFGIVVLGVLAGLINPRQTYTIILNFAVALTGLLFFEYYAISNFLDNQTAFFIANQCLAILFFVALYYATKTLRGHYAK